MSRQTRRRGRPAHRSAPQAPDKLRLTFGGWGVLMLIGAYIVAIFLGHPAEGNLLPVVTGAVGLLIGARQHESAL